jgi:transcriptional regulator with XRE-family HTH domain
MSISKKDDPKFVMAYDRALFRSAILSLFWAVISDRKKRGGFTFQSFAKKIGSTKHEVSRWFSGDPNWTLNTIASIANALDLDLRIEAVERSTGRVFTSSGIKAPQINTVSPQRVEGRQQNLLAPTLIKQDQNGTSVQIPSSIQFAAAA